LDGKLITLLFGNAQVTYGLGAQGVRGTTTAVLPSTSPLTNSIIDLDSGEYFTRISGTIVTSAGSLVPIRVASLTFSTNKQVYGPFGVPSTDKPFEVQGPVHAFHGAVAKGAMSDILTAVGFWKVPISKQVATSGNWNGKV
jgi:hypothetical protein